MKRSPRPCRKAVENVRAKVHVVRPHNCTRFGSYGQKSTAVEIESSTFPDLHCLATTGVSAPRTMSPALLAEAYGKMGRKQEADAGLALTGTMRQNSADDPPPYLATLYQGSLLSLKPAR